MATSLSKSPNMVGLPSVYDRFGVSRPEKLDYRVPMIRGWDFVNNRWTFDIREISDFKKTVLSFWTGSLDWLGNPVYVYDLVNLPYSSVDRIIDAIYIVLFSREDKTGKMIGHPGGYNFVLQARDQLVGSWSGSAVEIVGNCFTMPDNPAVISATKLIHVSKVHDGRVI